MDWAEGVPLWYDPSIFEGCLALSFVLPQKLPIEDGAKPVLIDAEYARIHGAHVDDVDREWASLPFNCLLYVRQVEISPDPMFEDANLARSLLRLVTSTTASGVANDAPSGKKQPAKSRTAAVLLIPVKSKVAALRPPHGKVDPVTLCHWILSDLVRTLRITAQAPLRELPYEALTPIIPVTFGSGPSVGSFVFDGTEQTLILPHSIDRVDFVAPEANIPVGTAFFELTRGSIHMLVRDHIAAAAASAEYGDKRGAIVSLAIACELFLDSLLAAMLWEDGATPELAAESWQQPSIVRRVKNEYAPRLGGTWDPNRAGPLSDWLNHVVNVRNSVLHSGRSPSSSEVQLAGDAAGRLTNFLARRLVLSWRSYPKAMAVFVGHKSVDEHASKKKRQEIHQELDRASSSAVDFHSWRDSWLSHRAKVEKRG